MNYRHWIFGLIILLALASQAPRLKDLLETSSSKPSPKDNQQRLLEILAAERWLYGRLVLNAPTPGRRAPGGTSRKELAQLALALSGGDSPSAEARHAVVLLRSNFAEGRELWEGLRLEMANLAGEGSAAGAAASAAASAAADLADPDGQQAIYFSDLAALEIEIARRFDEPRYWMWALEHALRARELGHPAVAAAVAFNLAVIADELSLSLGQAERQRLSVLEGESGWRSELGDYRPPTGAPGLVPQRKEFFALAGKAGRLDSEEQSRLEVLGEELSSRSGDAQWSEAVEELRLAGRQDDLGEAYREFYLGVLAYKSGADSQARSHLEKALAGMTAASSVFQGWPAVYLAAVEYKGNEFGASLETLDRLETELVGKDYFHLRGWASWLRAINFVALGQPLEALPAYQTALESFERSQSPEDQIAQWGLRGEALHILGRSDEAWRAFREAMRLRGPATDPRRLLAVLQPMVTAATEEGALRAALLLEDLLVETSRTADPRLQVLALAPRVDLRYRLGDHAGANEDLRRAWELAGQVENPDRFFADLQALAAQVGHQREIEPLDAAIELYAQKRYRTVWTHLAYETRAELRLRQGDLAGAASDLRKSLAIFEERLASTELGRGERWALRRQGRELYGRLLEMKGGGASEEDLFRLAEHAHEFGLDSRDFPQARGAKLGLAAIQSQLSPKVVLLHFTVSAHQVSIWRLRKGSPPENEVVAWERADLKQKVEDLRRAAARGNQTTDELAQVFSQRLIGRLEAPADTTLVLVPHAELEGLPFGLLRDADGNFLIERFPLVFAPSAGVFVSSRVAAPATGQVVVVSQPTLDPQLGLGALPKSREEAIAITSLYPDHLHLTAGEATLEALAQNLPKAKIFHFAGHGRLNGRQPDLSALFFASSRLSSGILYQRDIYGLPLAHGPVVVLSACETGASSPTAELGSTSLARAFLSAGASAVVAASWKVLDPSAAALMGKFHQALARGVEPAQALRQAQREYLADRRLFAVDPYGWAAFQLNGGMGHPGER